MSAGIAFVLSIWTIAVAAAVPSGAGRPGDAHAAGIGMPLLLVDNRERGDSQAQFLARGAGIRAAFLDRGIALQVEGDCVLMEFVGARSALEWEGVDRPTGRLNILVGHTPKSWRRNLPMHNGVVAREIYPGIDARVSGKRRLKSEFLVAPGADPSQIRFRYVGGTVSLDSGGTLRIRVGGAQLWESAPESFQWKEGRRVAVSSGYRIYPDGSVGFTVQGYDPAWPLLIDPTIGFSTFVGGTGEEVIKALGTDSAGNVYAAGWTESSDLIPSGSIYPYTRSVEAFVIKFNSSGTAVVYATFIGGELEDRAMGLAVTASGEAVVAGYTYSRNFPRVEAAQVNSGGYKEAFVAKLNAAGNGVVFSTFWGGSGSEAANAVAVDSTGAVVIAGETDSLNFPVKNAYQGTHAGQTDAFVARFSPAGDVVFSTYYGGTGNDRALALALDTQGRPHLAGATDSLNLPVSAGVIQSSSKGYLEGFVVKLEAGGTSRVFATYIGGNGGMYYMPDYISAIDVDGAGAIYIAGTTSSTNLFIQSAYQSQLRGLQDGFVTKLRADGRGLYYSTYIGGSASDTLTALRVDRAGNAWVCGYTISSDFPTMSPLQPQRGEDYDAFLTQLSSTGSAVLFSTFLGGQSGDAANALAIRGAAVYVAGSTASLNFPVR